MGSDKCCSPFLREASSAFYAHLNSISNERIVRSPARFRGRSPDGPRAGFFFPVGPREGEEHVPKYNGHRG